MWKWGVSVLASAIGACVPPVPGFTEPPAPEPASEATPAGLGLRAFPPLRDPSEIVGAPPLLAQTGLYADLASRTLAPGVRPFQPRYELWSDGAEKRRYVLLPTGARIDTGDMDRWQFPLGTRLWKEFRKGGKLLETRLLWKGRTGWRMATYVWSDDEATALRDDGGRTALRGTDHDVPEQRLCVRCHRDEVEAPLGFGAVQLSGAGAGLRLQDLVSEGLLTQAPQPGGYELPGDATAKAALGYLHGNCGGCHAQDTQLFQTITMSLRLPVGRLGAVSDTPAYRTTVNQATTTARVESLGRVRVIPGDPAASELWRRMGVRERLNPDSIQMPPIGTHLVDSAGRAAVEAWIRGL